MSKKTSRLLSAIIFQVTSRPSLESIGVERYRQLLEKSARAFKPDQSVIPEAFSINGIDAEWLNPPDPESGRIILYIHGGGFIAGSINSHRDLASRIAISARSRLLIFNYRLAPEHPFPAGLDDARTVYEWLSDHYGQDHSICLAGDSAGGGLALSLMVDCEDRKQTLPEKAVLISPWIDLACTSQSHDAKKGKDFMLNTETLKQTAKYYTRLSTSDPMVSPINNPLDNLPPTLIQVGENEILLDDATRLAEKIRQAGGSVELEIWDEMFHVWHYFARYLSEGRQAIARIGDFLNSSPDD